MTLVAAYSHKNIPVLIGDMALMKGDIRSFRKKVYIVSHNLAVGWTGHLLVAKEVIASLKQAFSNTIVTKESLEAFFTGYRPDDFGSLHTKFIGWIVDDEPCCFLWNCLHPQEVFYASFYIDGSGEHYFESLRKQKWHSGGDALPHDDQAVLSVITDVAHARFEESLYQTTWDVSFGASYDILMFFGGRFKYVESLAYIGWDYFWNSQKGTGRLEQAPVIIKHISMGEHSIIQQALHGRHYDRKTVNYLSRPVYDDMPGVNLSNYPLRLNADYYANYFLFREEGKTIFKLLLTVQNITKDGPLRIHRRDGAYLLDYDTDELDRIYREHTAEQLKG